MCQMEFILLLCQSTAIVVDVGNKTTRRYDAMGSISYDRKRAFPNAICCAECHPSPCIYTLIEHCKSGSFTLLMGMEKALRISYCLSFISGMYTIERTTVNGIEMGNSVG